MDSDKHFIVAIGASAGGLEAIHEFFDNSPGEKNISYVIIQHLSPDYKSLLVELVSRHTDMRVYEAESNIIIEPNCVYVIPNNKLITVKGYKLQLEDKGSLKAPNNAIDVFLFSLAKEKKKNAIAVILSGTGTDGTRGIEEVKKKGGLVIVQDPVSAKFDGMPNSAINSGNVDFVLSPAEMYEEISNYARQRMAGSIIETLIDEQTLQKIFSLIHAVAGFDFNYYKTPTIVRRIQRRMLRGNFRDIHSYIAFLQSNPEETRQLGKDFLIGVTKFFRDRGAFDYLQKNVLDELVREKEYGETFKVWVTACSTGEEAYSIAILINEACEKHNKVLDVKIFATDLENSNVEIASQAVYPESIEKDVDPLFLRKYFVQTGKTYSVIPKIRKQIVFANHNILKDPPFVKNDLVTCRNMLIYMNPVLQQRVYSLLLFSVKRDGYLFFGSSENPNYHKDSVFEVHSKWKIFKKVADTKLSIGSHLELTNKKVGHGRSPVKHHSGETTMQIQLWEDFRKTLSDEIFFAALYVDQNFDVKEAIGNYEKILALPKKTLRLNILRMVPQSLSALLNSSISKAWKTRQTVVMRNVRYEDQGSQYSFQLLIKPALEVTSCTMIVFSNYQKIEDLDSSSVVPLSAEGKHNEYLRALENELIETKNNLQIVVEDLETVNEELQSSNEELLSANEELQSSNEELQSLNEELHTLNTEHQLKIKELLELNDDLNNYFRSTDIGQIFLTRDLRIRKFNPASAKMINFIESDLGRPFSHISTNVRYSGLIADINEVLNENITIEKEVQLVNGKSVLMRILPYITRDKVNDGVIVSFIDVTTITDLNNIIRGVFNSSQSAIFAFKAIRDQDYSIHDFVVLTANHAAGHFLRADGETYEGRSMKRDIPLITVNGLFDKFVKVVAEDKPLYTDVFYEIEAEWYEVSAVKMTDGLVATFTNITEKKLAEQRLKKNYVELVSVKDNLKKLNVELENKVRDRTRELSESEERFRIVAQATNDAIWDWNFLNNSVWWGDSFYKLFGYTKNSIDNTRKFWLDKIHPDDVEGTAESIQEVINSHQNQWSCEYRFRKADGTYANILDRGYVLHDENGTPFRMLGSMLDLTDLKHAEQEVRSNIQQREFLAESMPLIVMTADPHFNINFVNNQFESYTGREPSGDIGESWDQAVHADDLLRLTEEWRTASQKGQDFEQEFRLMHHSGEYRWNIIRARPRTDGNGALLSWVITVIDIHVRKLLNETLEQKVRERTQELQRINHALEASNHDLQQFASVASHDLQEPLRKIHMFSKLISDKHSANLPDEARTFLQKIMQSSGRMKSIIMNVLSFSRLSAEDNHFEKVGLHELIAELLDDLEITIRERNATIRVASMCEVEVIPGQIRQVFQNLLSNSLKFSRPDTPPEITITSQNVSHKSLTAPNAKDGSYCRITIKDNGIGFDEKFRDKIFALFHRLHSKDRFEGTGIGLAIVKKIVEKHHGLITAFSPDGQGATFIIVLPVKQNMKESNPEVYDKAHSTGR
jgi:two-component system, chemotaxis family, CheB/CheR fusion protein